MEDRQKIVIGSRGSELALKQSAIVKEALLAHEPQLQVEVQVIKTEGDGNMAPIPLDTVGKGWFTKEIERALAEGTIDLAVHSLKDLPQELPEGLMLGAYLNREDPRDVLISKEGKRLESLPSGAIVGTDSVRRATQILALRPDVRIESVRGNVPTRVAKLDEGSYDAIVIAAAGLRRLGLEGRISQYFTVDEVTPAPGQGILAVEVRESDPRTATFMRAIDDATVRALALCERNFSDALDGGCKTPLGAHAILAQDTVTLHGMVANDAGVVFRDTAQGGLSDAPKVGFALAEKMRALMHG